MSSPWADPATPTQPGAPYAGPLLGPSQGYGPQGYGLPGYGPPGYGPPGYGWSPYGYPGYHAWPGPPAPRAPQRPGQVIAAAILAFVQAALVLITSLYVYFFSSAVEIIARDAPLPEAFSSLAAEGTVLAIVQVLSAAFLVGAGIRALGRPTPLAGRLLAAALGVQVLLAVYWLVRLLQFDRDLPGPDGDSPLPVFTLLYAAMPLVALALLVLGSARQWFSGGRQP